MISQVTGTLATREIDRVEIMTAGGVAYECAIPLSVYESLPQTGQKVSLHTHLAVREDGWQLYAFQNAYERSVFQRLLSAKGVGPALALGILSSLNADRVVRALREKDVTTLMRVPRVGRKKAEQIILDLADKIDTVAASSPTGATSVTPLGSDAVRALVALGYPQGDAEKAVKSVVDKGENRDLSQVVRAALSSLTR